MSTFGKKIFIASIFATAIFFVAIFADSAFAGSAVLNWNANSESDLAGYKIYYDTSSHAGNCPAGYASNLDAGNVTTYTINDLSEGHDYYFQLTAYDNANPANESSCSINPGEVMKTIYFKGDLDENRAVNIFDYSTLVANFGQTNCENLADTDDNCKVDIFDYNNLVGDFGKSF